MSRTRREYGQLIFGKSYGYQVTGGSSGGYGRSSGSSYSSVVRGTLTQDTWDDPTYGKRALILVDGDDSPGEYSVDIDMKSGQRVQIIMFGSQAVVMPIGSVILDAANTTSAGMIRDAKTDLEQQIANSAEQIKQDAVQESTASVDGKLEKNKSEIQNWVSDNYTSKSDMGSYATTSDLTQTSESLTATFTQSLNTKGKTFIGQPSPPYEAGDVWIEPQEGIAYTCTKSRASGSYNSSDWTDHDAFVSAFVRSDYDGVTVGKTESDWKARVSSRGTFDILDSSDDVVTQIGNDSDGAYITTDDSSLCMRSSDGYAVTTVGNSFVSFSAMNGVRSTSDSVDYTVYFRSSGGLAMFASCIYSSTSGSTWPVTLKQNITYFTKIDVYYEDSGGRIQMASVMNPYSSSSAGRISNGQTLTISRMVTDGSQIYASTAILTLSGMTISRGNSQQVVISPSGNSSSQFDLRIRLVIGWRR